MEFFFFVEYGSNLARLYLKVGMGSKRDSSYSNVHISQRKKSLPQKKKKSWKSDILASLQLPTV